MQSGPVWKAQTIQVICVQVSVGKGTDDDPARRIDQYWSLDGELLATRDLILGLQNQLAYESDQKTD